MIQTFVVSLLSLSVGACARVPPTTDWALESFWCRSFSWAAAYARFCEESDLRMTQGGRPNDERTEINGL